MSSGAALPQSASAASLVDLEEEGNAALYEDLFGSPSSPAPVEPAWRRGTDAEVNNEAESNAGLPDIADGPRVEVGDGGGAESLASATDGGLTDEEEGAIADNGEGDAGDDGLLRDEHVEDVVDVSDDDVAVARPAEDVQAARPRIIVRDAYLQAQPNLDICTLLGYTLIVPGNVDVDHTMCGLSNLGNTCWGELSTPSLCQDPHSTSLVTAT
jgi:hypothetical protein